MYRDPSHEIVKIYNGMVNLKKIVYIVEFMGDIPRTTTKNFDLARASTFEAALELAERWAPMPDPEDDRILIWQVLESGHKRVVWHFSGRHWFSDEFGEQGKYLGHEKTLYEECCEGL